MPGILRVRETIDREQFWPGGESDAGTSKVKVTVGQKLVIAKNEGPSRALEG